MSLESLRTEPTRLLRKSGVAVGMFCYYLDWRPDFIIQVGIGIHHEEVAVLHREFPDARWAGCEPHPDCANAARRDYPGEVYECAIGREKATAVLRCKPGHKDGSSTCELDRCPEAVEIEVPQTTLDHLFVRPRVGTNTLLWLDCEGSELAALQGASLLLPGVDMINVETTAQRRGAGWCSPEDIYLHLAVDDDFYLQTVHSHRDVAGQADAVYVRSHLFRPDCCCIPTERLRWYEEREGN